MYFNIAVPAVDNKIVKPLVGLYEPLIHIMIIISKSNLGYS